MISEQILKSNIRLVSRVVPLCAELPAILLADWRPSKMLAVLLPDEVKSITGRAKMVWQLHLTAHFGLQVILVDFVM